MEIIRRGYLFRRDYEIRVLKTDDRAYSPLPSIVAIYTDQWEVWLRIPTSTFIRSSLRYWAMRITQLTPNAIWVLIGFELIYHLLNVNLLINLFRCFYTIKKHGNDRWWFYFSSRHKVNWRHADVNQVLEGTIHLCVRKEFLGRVLVDADQHPKWFYSQDPGTPSFWENQKVGKHLKWVVLSQGNFSEGRN